MAPIMRLGRSRSVVGLGRLERPTSPLSGVRSNRLSYRPETSRRKSRERDPDHALSGEERETKTAASRQMGPDWPRVFQEFRPDRPEWRLVKGTSLERR